MMIDGMSGLNSYIPTQFYNSKKKNQPNSMVPREKVNPLLYFYRIQSDVCIQYYSILKCEGPFKNYVSP